MSKYLKIILSIFILVSISSCKVVKSVSEMKKTDAEIYSYAISDKEIKYIPMHHLGKKEFYDDVKNKISDFKKNGYIVYYEQISTKFGNDSLQNDVIRRKVRKIKGFGGSYDDVTEGTMFEKYIEQPSYPELGITDSDIRADVDYLQFINEWEKQNGAVTLESIDYSTPFDAKYEKGTFYSNQQYKNIVINYRNNYLIDLIKSKADKKILIVYGEGHRKDFEAKISMNR